MTMNIGTPFGLAFASGIKAYLPLERKQSPRTLAIQSPYPCKREGTLQKPPPPYVGFSGFFLKIW
jgi:hypothetical protein